MLAFARFPLGAVAVIGAAAAVAATAGPALAFPAARQVPAVTNVRDYLGSVAASSASNAWAVGSYQHGNAQLTLTEHWNGTRWKLVPSPNPGGTAGQSFLFGVAVRASQAWAVGRYWDGKANQTLAEQWNGTAWKKVPSANPGGAASNSQFEKVAYYSRSRAWAVGYYTIGSVFQALIERWNGAAWTVVPSPPVSASHLKGIAVVSPSNAWAVGYYATGLAQTQTLIEHWNGINWTTVPSPDPSTSAQVLDSVTAVSASDAWAVGYYTDSSSQIQTLTLHWNGTSWQQVSSPDVGGAANYNVLNGVTAASSSSAWADGYDTHNGQYQTLVLHWNGTSWKHVASPNPGPGFNYLNGIAMTSKSAPWAVGDYVRPAGQLTLTERWNGTRWRMVASPSK